MSQQSGPDRARTIVHPGRFNPIRIQSKHSAAARHFRLLLEPGVTLYDAIVGPLATVGVTNASLTILGGDFTQMQYCVAPPDPSKEAIIRYSDPIDAGAAFMVFGNATLGFSMKDEPLVHCHAAIRREDGKVFGGHILTEKSVLGDAPIPVLVTSLDEFSLRQKYDPETNIPLLKPEEEPPHG